jgi:hypothetical protein
MWFRLPGSPTGLGLTPAQQRIVLLYLDEIGRWRRPKSRKRPSRTEIEAITAAWMAVERQNERQKTQGNPMTKYPDTLG